MQGKTIIRLLAGVIPVVAIVLVHRFHETDHMRRIHFCGHGL